MARVRTPEGRSALADLRTSVSFKIFWHSTSSNEPGGAALSRFSAALASLLLVASMPSHKVDATENRADSGLEPPRLSFRYISKM